VPTQPLTHLAHEFFADHSRDHAALHSHDISTLSTVSLSSHILTKPLVKLFRTEKYVVNMSSASYGLFMGWLSDVGLEALWDTGREIGPGRQKEAVRNIVVQRLDLRGEWSLQCPNELPDCLLTTLRSH
jgi:transcription initiation factor TFIID subunit 5